MARRQMMKRKKTVPTISFVNERKTNPDWFQNLDDPRFRQDWRFVPTTHKKDLKIDALQKVGTPFKHLLAVTIRNLRGDTLSTKPC